jgi:nitroimidazol reductase NimA-like FMN-containing flavoprotein (pyridoxamine 5'-phosphate oxidase superfamily)
VRPPCATDRKKRNERPHPCKNFDDSRDKTVAVEPRAELITPPIGYGDSTTPLAWGTVRAELEQARQYWLAMLRSAGSPHVVPLDGLWLDDVWHFGGSPETLHRRLVATHPEVTMHLQDPWRCVVVEGVVEVAANPPEAARHLAEASFAKYPEYGPAPVERYAESPRLLPRRVIAWTNFPADMTRFLFD